MLILALLAACGGDKTPTDFTGADLLGEIDGYAAWDQPTGWAGVVPSCDGTHGPFVSIWENPTAAGSSGTYADGSILVKEGIQADGTTVNTITVMRKLSGYDADHGDWFWGQFDADLTELNSGMIGACEGCHAASSGDYVLYPDSTAVTDAADCP